MFHLRNKILERLIEIGYKKVWNLFPKINCHAFTIGEVINYAFQKTNVWHNISSVFISNTKIFVFILLHLNVLMHLNKKKSNVSFM